MIGNTVLARGDCRAGGMIFRLDRDDDVEFFMRIVQSLDRREQLIDDASFTAQRDDDAVNGLLFVLRIGEFIR